MYSWNVRELTTPQVHGKGSSDHYLVFPDHYCSCKAFLFDIVGRSEAVFVSGPPNLSVSNPSRSTHHLRCEVCRHVSSKECFLGCKHPVRDSVQNPVWGNASDASRDARWWGGACVQVMR